MGELTQRVQSALKAEPLQRDSIFGGGLGHGAADQVVRDETKIDFFLNHLGRAATEHFHLQSGLEIIQTHLQAPTPQVGRQRLAQRVADLPVHRNHREAEAEHAHRDDEQLSHERPVAKLELGAHRETKTLSISVR